MIEHRDPLIELRNDAEHWEIDTVVSRKIKAAISAPLERKSRYLITLFLKFSASSARSAMAKSLWVSQAVRTVKTITVIRDMIMSKTLERVSRFKSE